MKRYFFLALVGLVSDNTLAQSLEHVNAVRHAQRSAYAITDATNGCPIISSDVLGWPGSRVRKCVYVEGPTQNQLTGIAFLLDVRPESIASWIEASCASLLPGYSACFDTILKCGQENSGMMFPISGDVMENMNPKTWKNYFFRNGMTVAIDGETNGSTVQIPIEKQEAFASSPDHAIVSIPSGVTRFWRTLPRQFAARFPDSQAPSMLDSATARQKWLNLAKSELLAALAQPENRLLDAWMSAHPKTIGRGVCPGDGDP
jgi:hypothetical protein